MPGDRYELDKGHWQKVGGPIRAMTRAQTHEAVRLIGEVVARTRGPASARRGERTT